MLNQKRVVIDFVSPTVNNGDFYSKRVINQLVQVQANIVADGHDVIGASVLYKHEKDKNWSEVRMSHVNNDEWSATFRVEKIGFYEFKVQGWIDYALNWQHGIERKIDDNQQVFSELLEGVEYLNKLSATLKKTDFVKNTIEIFSKKDKYQEALQLAKSEALHQLFVENPTKFLANETKKYKIFVERKKALFSTWYEFFPRSASSVEGKHGTFKDCERLLPRVQKMGFDTLYFPPIHPIGEINRKGKNNTTKALADDVGSTWGIGSKFGGHKDIHPQLGTLDDFKSLIQKAEELGIEIAMDFALQAAPDHPWVKKHPNWFKWRPDGTVQYAENPPKKYQDILPIYFETEDYKNLWEECLSIFYYWIDCGIKVFRIDNPHTKPFYFWNWIISSVQKKYPEVIFLAEAFTKPKVMQQLAKQGFTQSYTYFTWRNTKHELTEYVKELTQSDTKEYMRPNFWANTPDINPFHLQGANETKHIQRYVLAATLSSNIGIYGPVFEQMLSQPLPGKEEYLNSEKFQLAHYNWEIENKVTTLISRINRIRNENEALQQTNNISFLNIQNDNLIAFYKWDDVKTNEILVVINLDEHHMQQGMVQLPLNQLNIHSGQAIELTDLITSNTYTWNNEWNYVELHPSIPFHIFKIKK